MTDDALRRRIDMDRAAKAAALLDNELLKECFEALERQYVQGWIESPPNDAEARERAWMAVRVIRAVQEQLGRMVTHGRLAQRILDDLHPNKVG